MKSGSKGGMVSLEALCYALIEATTWNEHLGIPHTYNQKDFMLNYIEKSKSNKMEPKYESCRRDQPDAQIWVKESNLFNETGNEDKFNDEIFPFKITKLIVKNSSGFNDDPRCRMTEREELYPGYEKLYDPERQIERFPLPWLVNYKSRCEIENTKGITYKDLAKGIFSVKSGKRDNWYELFIFAGIDFDIENKELYITLKFDHGS